MGFFRSSPQELIEAALRRAMQAAQHGQFEAARKACDEAWAQADQLTDDAEARTAVAMMTVNVCVAGNEWRAAEYALKKLCASLSTTHGLDALETISAQRTLCDLLFQRGKSAEAVTVLEKIVRRLTPGTANHAHLQGELAGMRSKAGDHAQATVLITELRQVVYEHTPPGHAERTWVDQCAATILLRAAQLAPAQQLAIAAYQANPLDEAAVLTYAEVLRRTGDFAGAMQVCRALARASGDEPDATLLETMADILRDAGQLEAALQAYAQATQLVVAQGGPDHFNLLTLLEGHAATLRLLGQDTPARTLEDRRAEIEQIVRR